MKLNSTATKAQLLDAYGSALQALDVLAAEYTASQARLTHCEAKLRQDAEESARLVKTLALACATLARDKVAANVAREAAEAERDQALAAEYNALAALPPFRLRCAFAEDGKPWTTGNDADETSVELYHANGEFTGAILCQGTDMISAIGVVPADNLRSAIARAEKAESNPARYAR